MPARPSRALARFLLAALSACRASPTPAPPADEPEAPRAEVELLVERFSRGGARSFLAMSPDGARVAPFDGVPADALLVAPSPDGRTLALVRPGADGDELWLAGRDGGGARAIRGGRRGIGGVAWSPDGARLVLSESTDAVAEDLVVVDAEGREEADLTPDPLPAVFFDRDPAWSPDGARIAFSTNRSGSRCIWLVGADGSSPRQLVADDGLVQTAPAWSPDGAWIAFAAEGAGGGVAVVRADGTARRVFPVAGEVVRPAWTPDGRVAFGSRATGNWEILALDPATGETRNLTGTVAHEVSAAPLRYVPPPAWRGLGPPRTIAMGAPAAPGLAAADVDGDGLPDLLALAPSLGQLRIALGRGGGALSPLGGVETLAGARALAAADLTLDGIADVAVLGPGDLQVFGGSAGGPGVPAAYPLGGEGRALAALDVDDDGAAELAAIVARGDGPPFHVLGFAATAGGPVLYLDVAVELGGATAACAGDATGEGWGDLVVLTAGAGTSAAIVPGLGPSLSSPLAAASGLDLPPGTVPACADLDGDRRADLVLLRPGASELEVLRSTGGGFGPPERHPFAPAGLGSGAAIAAADLDRDGDVDLVVADARAGAVAVLRNLGDGRFASARTVAIGASPTALAAVDLDGDRWPDVAVADASGAVHVLANLGAAP